MTPNGTEDPTNPTPVKESRLDRFAHWLERASRTAYEEDKPLIESEGTVLVEPLVPARVTLTRFGAFRIFWGDVTVVVTRERFRIYSGFSSELVDVSLTDTEVLRKIVASLESSDRLHVRVPSRVGRGRNARARANRRIKITTPRAPEIRDLIHAAQMAALGND